MNIIRYVHLIYDTYIFRCYQIFKCFIKLGNDRLRDLVVKRDDAQTNLEFWDTEHDRRLIFRTLKLLVFSTNGSRRWRRDH